MRKFQFRLERVLGWRRTQLELEEHKLKTLAAEMDAIERRRAQLALDRTLAERHVLAEPRLDGSLLEAHAAYLAGLSLQEQRLERVRQEQEQRIASQHQRVLEARRRCRLLERLRARALADWQAEADRELENTATELYLARWNQTP